MCALFAKETNMKKIAAIFIALWMLALTGCNTVHGLGKDVEKAGEAIQRKADR
jgi:predicted small secreted protein